MTDNNNFVSTAAPMLSNGVSGSDPLSVNSVISVSMEDDEEQITEDIIEVDSTNFDTGIESRLGIECLRLFKVCFINFCWYYLGDFKYD